jgi:hypothetical protein
MTGSRVIAVRDENGQTRDLSWRTKYNLNVNAPMLMCWGGLRDCNRKLVGEDASATYQMIQIRLPSQRISV